MTIISNVETKTTVIIKLSEIQFVWNENIYNGSLVIV